MEKTNLSPIKIIKYIFIRGPLELRKEAGNVTVANKTPEGFIMISSEHADFMKEFRRTIASVPPRTGKPENWPPSKMKTPPIRSH